MIVSTVDLIADALQRAGMKHAQLRAHYAEAVMTALSGDSTTDAVRAFHEAFGFHVEDEPAVPPEHIRAERARLIAEEAGELIAEILANHPDRHDLTGTIRAIFEDRSCPIDRRPEPVKVARELADLRYVTDGGAVNWGIPLDVVFAEVHAANMRKLGPDGRPIVDGNGKACKPEGWYPADVDGALRNWSTRKWSA